MSSELDRRGAADWSSRASHSQIINDKYIQEFLKQCRLPSRPKADPVKTKEVVHAIEDCDLGEKHILTVDGSYTLVSVQKNFPSSQLAFFQFGAILFTTKDLEDLSAIPFISPEDMNKLHNLQRIKLVLPLKNITSGGKGSLNESIRKAIYDFFRKEVSSGVSLIETLAWLVFEQYKSSPVDEYTLSSNPNLHSAPGSVILNRSCMRSDYTFDSNGQGKIYLTDVFRLHEVIDEDFGATGILGYVSRLVEQLILLRYLKIIFSARPSALRDFMFITNGPLSFSGPTANMHKLVRKLCNHLLEDKNLYLFGVERVGPFVEHALKICREDKEGKGEFYLAKGQYLILSNQYIYNYITPGDSEVMHYGSTSYYGGKVVVHTDDDQVFVISIPITDADVIKKPVIGDYKNLNEIIGVLKLLKCEMYKDSIVPVAIANKLISLANHPSKSILENFARELL